MKIFSMLSRRCSFIFHICTYNLPTLHSYGDVQKKIKVIPTQKSLGRLITCWLGPEKENSKELMLLLQLSWGLTSDVLVFRCSPVKKTEVAKQVGAHYKPYLWDFWKKISEKKSFWLCFLRKVDTTMMSSENGFSNRAASAFDNQSFQTWGTEFLRSKSILNGA